VEKLVLYVLIFDKLKWIHTFRLFPFYEYSAICSMTRIIYIMMKSIVIMTIRWHKRSLSDIVVQKVFGERFVTFVDKMSMFNVKKKWVCTLISQRTDLFSAHIILLNGIFRDLISQHHEIKRIANLRILIHLGVVFAHCCKC